jgi:hypothetical protein
VRASSLVSGMIIAISLLIRISKTRVVTYDLLFRWWPRLEIDRIVSEVTTGLPVADNKRYINIAELCKLVSLVK